MPRLKFALLLPSVAVVITLASAQCVAQSASSDGIPQQERQVLVEVFRATDGNHWNNHDGWLGAPGTECDWHGVLCERGADGARSVTLLDLSENNLNGRIPDEISELAHLDTLIIFGNRLSGRLPDAVIERWVEGTLWVTAETPLLTDVSLIDFESYPSALLCGQRRLVLRSDTSAVSYVNRCRNATPSDGTTYCEVKQGKMWWQEFARLAWFLEKNGFFALKPNYERNVTDGAFVSTRVVRLGKSYEIVDYAGGGPLSLWAIHQSIEGVGASLDWEKTTSQPTCPAWAPLATANCDPLPTLEISDVRTTLVGNEWKEDRVIDATASKDGKPLPLAIVRLYIGTVLVEWTMADKRGHFLLENLTVGPYTLSIQGIGRFRLELTPPRIHQQSFYSFSSNHGCLDWGATSN